ncbi:unnamed protein product [Ixodes persulcatus]
MSGFRYILALFDLSAPVQKSVEDCTSSSVLRYDRKYTTLHFFTPVQVNRRKLLIMCCCPTSEEQSTNSSHSRAAPSTKCITHTHTEYLLQLRRVSVSVLPE